MDKDININDFKNVLVKEIVYALIYGEFSKIEFIKKVLPHFGMNKIPNSLMTLLVDDFWDLCNDLNNRERYYVKKEITDLVVKATRDYPALVTSLFGTDKIIILLDLGDCSQEQTSERIYTIANKIRQYILDNSDYSITIGLGNNYRDYRDLWKSYEESFLAINYSFSIKKNSIINIKDVIEYSPKEKEDSNFLFYEYEIYKNIIRGDLEILLDNYNRMFEHLYNMRLHSDYMKAKISRFIIELTEFSCKFLYRKDYFDKEMVAVSSKIMRLNSISTIKEVVAEYLEIINKEVKQNLSNDLLLDYAVDFINKYYYKDLKLEDLSYISCMSQYTFSRQFKKKFNKNFSIYLLDYRLEKSREYLIETDFSIKEISEMVGFKNPSYFTNKFREKYSYPPNQYRKEINIKE